MKGQLEGLLGMVDQVKLLMEHGRVYSVRFHKIRSNQKFFCRKIIFLDPFWKSPLLFTPFQDFYHCYAAI